MKHISGLPPLDAVQTVLLAAQTGSFSAAAASQNITHGAVSRRVATVEAWAGVNIFSRHGRGVRLTLEGERFVARSELALAMLDDSRRKAREHPQVEVIRVGVVASFARLVMVPNLASLEGQPPDLRVELEVDDRHMPLSDARIAIRLGRGGWPGVVAEPLFDETFQPLAAAPLARALGPHASAADLLEYPILHDANEDNWRLWFSHEGIAYDLRPQDRVFSAYDLTLTAAAGGIGIALARDPYGRQAWQRMELSKVHDARLANVQRFHIVTRPGPRHPTVQRLVSRLHALADTLS